LVKKISKKPFFFKNGPYFFLQDPDNLKWMAYYDNMGSFKGIFPSDYLIPGTGSRDLSI